MVKRKGNFDLGILGEISGEFDPINVGSCPSSFLGKLFTKDTFCVVGSC